MRTESAEMNPLSHERFYSPAVDKFCSCVRDSRKQVHKLVDLRGSGCDTCIPAVQPFRRPCSTAHRLIMKLLRGASNNYKLLKFVNPLHGSGPEETRMAAGKEKRDKRFLSMIHYSILPMSITSFYLSSRYLVK